MNLSVQIKNTFFDYLENIKSENLGFYCSFFLHLLILLFVIGLPNFFDPKPISIPIIIPIEIINVTEFNTSISKENNKSEFTENKKVKVKEKKFNSSDNLEIKKIEIKDKPEIIKEKKFNSSDNLEIKKIEIKDKSEIINNEIEKTITQKEAIVIKEKNEIPIELDKENIKIDTSHFESLPSKKVRPKLKPKLKKVTESPEQKSDVVFQAEPKPKPEKKWDLATAMKDIREDQSTLSVDQDLKDIEQEEIIINKEYAEIDKETEKQAIISIKNAVRQQYYQCWSNNSGKLKDVGIDEFVIAYARYTRNGSVIDDTVQIRATNINHKTILINEVKYALYTCRLNLPEEFFYLWENMTVRFDYNAMNKEILGIKQKKLNLFN